MLEVPFQKDMSHGVSWDQVYRRQARRADLLSAWIDALGVKPGDRVLDIGSGPGFFSLKLADQVGSQGMVYAIDASAEAIAYLERIQADAKVLNIRRLVADVGKLGDADIAANSALITMVLHHAEDPAGILRAVHRLLAPNGLVVVAEFHPEGPCEVGASRADRVAPEQVQGWCKAAGFHIREYRRQTPEHYMIIAERSPSTAAMPVEARNNVN